MKLLPLLRLIIIRRRRISFLKIGYLINNSKFYFCRTISKKIAACIVAQG